MKTILLALCIFTISAYGLPTPTFLQVGYNFEDCLKENNIEGNFFEKLESNDTNALCVLACTLEKQNVIKDGVIDKDELTTMEGHINEIFPDEKLSKSPDDCISNETDKCAIANKIISCFNNGLKNILKHK